MTAGRVLVVDPDPVVARFLAADLDGEGYAVDVLGDPAATLARTMTALPDLVLLEAGNGGLDVLRTLRSHPPTASLPVILLTASPDPGERVLGLAAGADDVVGKPFDTLDLVSRVGATLRRTADMRALSPLTGLPGNHRIDSEIAARSAGGEAFAVCHVDLDDFKGFNDAYGFSRGDDLLLLLAASLQRAVLAAGDPPAFVGHIGGDDFVVVAGREQAEPLCREAVQDFDARSPALHDPVDAERGWLEVVDRRGELRRQPLVCVSVGIAFSGAGDQDPRAVLAAANEMKSVAKSASGSLVAVDRRS